MKEANQWKKTNDGKPRLFKKTKKIDDFWKNFRHNNLKITRLISIKINSFFRNIKT